MRLLVKDIGKQKVYIGFRGEQNYAEISFDFSNIFAEYPDADVAMRIKPPEGETYPHSLTREENIVVWHVNASDCANAGMGSYQVTFTSGNTIVKSFVGLYVVRESLDVTGDPPDPYVSWLEELEEIASNVHQEIEEAEETMSGYLEESKDARDTAVASAETAVAANESAQAAAQTANTKAFEATEAARTATSKANEANASAMMAENYKTTAVNAASQAASAANTAMQSATVATTKATEAANSAASALNSKTAAETSAATASQASAAAVAANTEVQEAKEIVVAAKDTTVAAKDRVEELVESLPDDFDALVEDVAKLKTDVGDTTELETEAKSDLVSAVNEVHGDLSGKADLENGKVPASQLPSYVDDVLEYSSFSAFPATGETGKIYVALDTNNTYRWSGSTYIQINDVLELIDDEAGIGDTEKVWSADKIAKEVNNLTEQIEAKPDIDDTAGAGDTDKTWSADKITQELDNLDPTLTESIESTAIATFDDGADDLPLEELRVEINPVQDLHGYDKPWVGGAGKNLCYMTLAKLIEWNTDGTWEGNVYTRRGATFTVNTDSDGNVEEIVVNGTPTDTAWLRVSNEPFTLSEDCKFNGLPSVGSSNTFQFRLQPNTINIRENDVSISAGEYESLSFCIYASYTANNFVIKPMIYRATETDTSYAPYSNICSISGYTGVEVRDEGKNLFTTEGQTTPAYINNQGTIYTNSNDWILSDYIPVLAKTQYTFKPNSTSGSAAKHGFYNANKEFMTYIDSGEQTFTTPENCAYMRFSYRVASTNIQLERGSVATEYVPFTGNNVYPIQFPTEAGTVYSGYLTVHKDGTGEVVADRGIVTIDGTETFINVTSANVFYVTKDVLSSYGLTTADDYCNMFRPVSATGSSYMEDGDIARQSLSNNRLFVKSSVFAGWTASQLATYFASNNLQICLGLQESLHFDLTTTQVRTLLGYNAISADSGNVALTYRKDSEVNYELARLEEKIDSRPEIINDETVSDDSVWSSEKVDHLTTTEQETVSGDIVTFETDAEQLLEQLTVSIAPVQDLHGYNHPWIGGAGKNLFGNGDITLTSKKYEGVTLVNPLPAGTYTVSAVVVSTDTDATTCRIGFYGSGATEVGTAVQLDRDARSSGTFTLTDTCVSFYFYTSDGATHGAGDSATYTDIMVETGSTATDFAPYANICPITGWDGVEVSRTGKNVFDSDVAQLTSNTNITVDGETQSKNNRSATVGYIRLKPETNYTISYSGATNNGVFYYKADKTFISYVSWEPSGRVFTTPAETAYARFSFAESNPPSNIQVEEGSTATAYEDSAQTYSISFPTSAGTVYGGTLTINRDGSGSLVVDTVSKIYTGASDEAWVKAFSGTIERYYTRLTDCIYNISRHECLSNMAVYRAEGNDVGTIFLSSFSSDGSNGARLYFVPTQECPDVATYKTWLASNNLQVVYELASPQTYSLTATQVCTLLGNNAIWADAGEVSVTYRKGSLADLTSMTNVESRTLSTLSMLAPIEFSPATSAHAVNDAFIVGDKLYRATASIAQGAVIAEGTNVEQTTIMTVLQNAWGVSF